MSQRTERSFKGIALNFKEESGGIDRCLFLSVVPQCDLLPSNRMQQKWQDSWVPRMWSVKIPSCLAHRLLSHASFSEKAVLWATFWRNVCNKKLSETSMTVPSWHPRGCVLLPQPVLGEGQRLSQPLDSQTESSCSWTCRSLPALPTFRNHEMK